KLAQRHGNEWTSVSGVHLQMDITRARLRNRDIGGRVAERRRDGAASLGRHDKAIRRQYHHWTVLQRTERGGAVLDIELIDDVERGHDDEQISARGKVR